VELRNFRLGEPACAVQEQRFPASFLRAGRKTTTMRGAFLCRKAKRAVGHVQFPGFVSGTKLSKNNLCAHIGSHRSLFVSGVGSLANLVPFMRATAFRLPFHPPRHTAFGIRALGALSRGVELSRCCTVGRPAHPGSLRQESPSHPLNSGKITSAPGRDRRGLRVKALWLGEDKMPGQKAMGSPG